MQVDESFTEYVAVRWSMLSRLATLLVGDERADELTRAALVRAYLRWPEIQESASADASVKRILAQESLKDLRPADGSSRVLGAGSPGADGTDLWTQIGALLPRQRAMLVLRHYEGLFDAEIAEALGCSASTVVAESLALETGIDLVDLREELLRRSDDAEIPHPPLDELLDAGRRARRQRRRRTWGWTAGVAAFVAVAVVLAGLLEAATGPADPTRTSSARFLSLLPAGPPPRIAYSAGRTLHLGNGREVRMTGDPSTLVQTRTWLYVGYLSGEIVRVDPATGDVVTVVGSSGGGLVTDPAGQHVAWLASDHGPADVVVATVTDSAVARSDVQRFPARPRCCDNPFVVDGITSDGHVVASLPAAHRVWAWSAPDAGTSQLREVHGLGGGLVSQVASVGVIVHQLPFAYVIGRLVGGRFVRTGVVNGREADFTDPLGRRVVYLDEDGGIHVTGIRVGGRSRRGGQDVQLRLPPIVDGYSSVHWEDADHVLLDVTDASLSHGALVRCAVEDGTCESAVRFAGPHVVAN
ncbi:MAG TPA: sigma factor-like helix-turn-helix DNA-binding protein [Marmoricola sp.]|nr:sigma factor-like helix-turn-helix DNA-binding protein [Marmoricola sp.]